MIRVPLVVFLASPFTCKYSYFLSLQVSSQHFNAGQVELIGVGLCTLISQTSSDGRSTFYVPNDLCRLLAWNYTLPPTLQFPGVAPVGHNYKSLWWNLSLTWMLFFTRRYRLNIGPPLCSNVFWDFLKNTDWDDSSRLNVDSMLYESHMAA